MAQNSDSSAVLVTGAAGFIASRVSELLTQQGRPVLGVDNLNDAYDRRIKEWRLQRLLRTPGFTFLHGDITSAETLAELANTRNNGSRPRFGAVLNLAARAGVRQSIENPDVYYQTNVIGTLNLLELCRAQGISKFVLASTSSVYGHSGMPFRTDMKTDEPLSPYAASKKAAELLCYTYHHLYGLDITIPRYFTVYGPAGRPDMSIFRFIRWIAEGEPLVLYGDGTQERDFTFVDDIAAGTIAASQLTGYNILNLGSDRPVTLNAVIKTVEGLFDKMAKIERRPFQPTDIVASWADISQARKLLGWEPRMSIEEGLARCVAWYRENRDWVRQLAL